jgi:hypothetical protein
MTALRVREAEDTKCDGDRSEEAEVEVAMAQ